MDVYKPSPTASAYFSRVEAMTSSELDDHLERNYSHESQLWPDYLDYVEEWKWNINHKLVNTRKDFIFQVLAKKHQTVKCGDHYHTFSDVPVPGEDVIVFSRPDDYVNVSSCWYQTMIATDHAVTNHPDLVRSITLTEPEAAFLRRMTGLRIANEGRTTPHLLSFDDFRRKWWSQESREAAMALIEKSEIPTPPPLTPPPVSQPHHLGHTSSTDKFTEGSAEPTKNLILPLIEELPIPKPQWFARDTRIIFPEPKVVRDHGLHNLLFARTDRKAVFNLINEIRSLAGSYAISPHALADAISECQRCNHNTSRPNTTIPMLLYAPPGSGKSTVLERRLFVGLDTDWLISLSDFNTVVAPFLKMSIPVITNQYHLGLSSSEKLFGYYNPNHLRRDATGRLYTTPHEIESFSRTFRHDVCMTRDTDHYMDSFILAILRMNYLYNQTRHNVLDYKRHKIKIRDTPPLDITIPDLISEIKQWNPKRGRRGKRFRKTPS
nr:MAG: hypothetical protein [brine shrimp partiti-like virus 2]